MSDQEVQELSRIIAKDITQIAHVGNLVDGFETVNRHQTSINRTRDNFDVVTTGPSGHQYFWSYEVNYPHKITTKNVDSIRNQLNK